MEESLGASTHKILDGIFDERLPADEPWAEHTGHRRAATNGQENTCMHIRSSDLTSAVRRHAGIWHRNERGRTIFATATTGSHGYTRRLAHI